jgi:hypothetical protein
LGGHRRHQRECSTKAGNGDTGQQQDAAHLTLPKAM